MLKDQLIQPPFKSPSAVLILENGDIFWGNGIGSENCAIGELCFNTSQTGYQEILTVCQLRYYGVHIHDCALGRLYKVWCSASHHRRTAANSDAQL